MARLIPYGEAQQKLAALRVADVLGRRYADDLMTRSLAKTAGVRVVHGMVKQAMVEKLAGVVVDAGGSFDRPHEFVKIAHAVLDEGEIQFLKEAGFFSKVTGALKGAAGKLKKLSPSAPAGGGLTRAQAKMMRRAGPQVATPAQAKKLAPVVADQANPRQMRQLRPVPPDPKNPVPQVGGGKGGGAPIQDGPRTLGDVVDIRRPAPARGGMADQRLQIQQSPQGMQAKPMGAGATAAPTTPPGKLRPVQTRTMSASEQAQAMARQPTPQAKPAAQPAAQQPAAQPKTRQDWGSYTEDPGYLIGPNGKRSKMLSKDFVDWQYRQRGMEPPPQPHWKGEGSGAPATGKAAPAAQPAQPAAPAQTSQVTGQAAGSAGKVQPAGQRIAPEPTGYQSPDEYVGELFRGSGAKASGRPKVEYGTATSGKGTQGQRVDPKQVAQETIQAMSTPAPQTVAKSPGQLVPNAPAGSSRRPAKEVKKTQKAQEKANKQFEKEQQQSQVTGDAAGSQGQVQQNDEKSKGILPFMWRNRLPLALGATAAGMYGLSKAAPVAGRILENTSTTPMAHSMGWSPVPYGYGHTPYGPGTPTMGRGA